MTPWRRREHHASRFQGVLEVRLAVPSLVDTCIDYILDSVLVPSTVANCLTASCSPEIKQQKCWLRTLPTSVSHRLLRAARAKHDNHKGIDRLLLVYLCALESTRHGGLSTPVYLYSSPVGRRRLLEALQDSSLVETYTQVDLDMYNFYHRKDLTHCWFEQDPEIEIERTKLEADEAFLVEDLLTRCLNVVILSLHTVCDDPMLQILAHTCTHLAHLDVSFSRNVSDLGVGHLCSRTSATWRSLRVLELEGTSFTLQGLDRLLDDLPGLIGVETSVMEDYLHALQADLALEEFSSTAATGSGLRLAAALKSPVVGGRASPPPLGLQRLSLSIDRYSGGGGRPSLLALVGQLFGRLTSLKLHQVHREEWRNLALISSLKHLSCLVVGGAPLSALLAALLVVGPGLRELRYACYAADQDGGQINFSAVSAACPNLQVLAISGNALVYSPHMEPSVVPSYRGGGALQCCLLPQLRKVTINVHAYVPRHVWASLMRGCLELESLELTQCEGLTDGSLLEQLASQPACLSRLRRFSVRGTHRGDIKLSEAAVAALRMRCPALDHVGDCYTWDLRAVSCTVDQIRGLL